MGLLSIWVLLSDLGKGPQKHDFDLDWELSESRGVLVIFFLEDRMTKVRLYH